jgi:hypothetical protein
MNSPETLATLGTRHRTLEKTVDGNDEWRVQKHWQHWPLRFSLTFYVLFPMLPVSLDCPFIIALYGIL